MRDGFGLDADRQADRGAGLIRFAGLVFDSDGAELSGPSGQPIALTRGELSLLRTFLARPGRVLSRDALLDAVSSRPLEPFDRSIDVLVGRLRKKIEADPKEPRLIVTIPGEGYRFDGLKAANGAARAAPDMQTLSVPEAAPTAVQSPRPRSRRLTALAALGALAIGGLILLMAVRLISERSRDRLASAPRLSVIVLPFENVVGDLQQDYFADALTDDLTSDLSHIDGSFVISRGTAFTYKGKPADPKQIGRELGVRYVLEGSVRRAGDRVAVNARLVSTDTGAQVWSDRFDGERERLGELQVEFVSRLANSLGMELVKAEALRAARERPGLPEATDLAMRGLATLFRPADNAGVNAAISLFEQALALDANNVPALVGLAHGMNARVMRFISTAPEQDIARGDEAVDRALAIQPENSSANLAKAELSFDRGQIASAIAQAERAVATDPNNADAQAQASFWRMFVGRSEDGFAGVEKALRLGPQDPSAPQWQFYICHLHTHLAQWEKAVPWCVKSLAGGPGNFYPLVDLAAAHAWLGHDKDAREAATELQKVYPGFTVKTWAKIRWTDDPTFNAQYARVVEGLRKAGVPEGEAEPE
jgi:adenylate cyclase